MKILETYIIQENTGIKTYKLLYFCTNNKWMLHNTHSGAHNWYNISEVSKEDALKLINNTK